MTSSYLSTSLRISALRASTVFWARSMARVTIALLVSFLASGGLLILLSLDYLGVVVILMMVMEMIIMAVFMIAYMMNPAGLMAGSVFGRIAGRNAAAFVRG